MNNEPCRAVIGAPSHIPEWQGTTQPVLFEGVIFVIIIQRVTNIYQKKPCTRHGKSQGAPQEAAPLVYSWSVQNLRKKRRSLLPADF